MKRRKMKKWIPWSEFYCHGEVSKCKWWKDLSESQNAFILRQKYCNYKKHCEQYKKDGNCKNCVCYEYKGITYPEPISMCVYLNYIEVGQYPLGDMCKICGEHKVDKLYKKYL